MNTDESAGNRAAESSTRKPKATENAISGTTSNDDTPTKNRRSVLTFLAISIIFALLASVAAFFWHESITVFLGTLLAVTGIVMTFLVAKHQDEETENLTQITKDVEKVSQETKRITDESQNLTSEINQVSKETNEIAVKTQAITDKINRVSGETNGLAGETKSIAAEIRLIAEKVESVVSDTHKLVRLNVEKASERDYLEPADESDEDDDAPIVGGDPNSPRPGFEDEAIRALESRNTKLDFNNLKWRPKTPLQSTSGNRGWFVESPNSASDERWFVRKARGMTIRKAMPREFLQTLKTQAGVDPRNIKLDFQTKDHGLAAWYARTYDDQLWKVWKSNRNPEAGIQVEKVNEDD